MVSGLVASSLSSGVWPSRLTPRPCRVIGCSSHARVSSWVLETPENLGGAHSGVCICMEPGELQVLGEDDPAFLGRFGSRRSWRVPIWRSQGAGVIYTKQQGWLLDQRYDIHVIQQAFQNAETTRPELSWFQGPHFIGVSLAGAGQSRSKQARAVAGGPNSRDLQHKAERC
jgi:hypothetical protein